MYGIRDRLRLAFALACRQVDLFQVKQIAVHRTRKGRTQSYERACSDAAEREVKHDQLACRPPADSRFIQVKQIAVHRTRKGRTQSYERACSDAAEREVKHDQLACRLLSVFL